MRRTIPLPYDPREREIGRFLARLAKDSHDSQESGASPPHNPLGTADETTRGLIRYYVAQLSGSSAEDAWHSLVEAGPGALPNTVEAIHAASDGQIRVSLIEVIGQYRSAEAVPFLTGFAGGRDAETWKAALDSVVMNGGQAALDALTDAGRTAPADQREWITGAVQQLIERRRPG